MCLCVREADDKTSLGLDSYHIILFTVHRAVDIVEVLVSQGASCRWGQRWLSIIKSPHFCGKCFKEGVCRRCGGGTNSSLSLIIIAVFGQVCVCLCAWVGGSRTHRRTRRWSSECDRGFPEPGRRYPPRTLLSHTSRRFLPGHKLAFSREQWLGGGSQRSVYDAFLENVSEIQLHTKCQHLQILSFAPPRGFSHS